MAFCLDDGVPLVEKPASANDTPTVALPSSASHVPTMKQAFQPQVPPVTPEPWQSGVSTPPQKRSLLPWLIGVIAMVMLGSAVVVAVIVLRPRKLPWHLTLRIVAPAGSREAAMKRTMTVLENRLDALGVSRFEVKPVGDPADGQIVLNLPAVKDPERIKAVISELGTLELAHVVGAASPAPFQTYATKEEAIASLGDNGSIPANRRVLIYRERAELADPSNSGKWVVVEAPAIIDGGQLRDARATRSRVSDREYNISFTLNADGAQKFGSWTSKNLNEYMGVVVNNEVKSIAFIKSPIYDQAEITGNFTKQSAEDLALTLKSGALPAPLEFMEEKVDK
jgi:preprotein translocase subunit SecD